MNGKISKNKNVTQRTFDFSKDNSHYLIWMLFVVGLIFLVTVIVQFGVLIKDIDGKREALRQLEIQMQSHIKAIDENISYGQSTLNRMLQEESLDQNIAYKPWISAIENLALSFRGDIFSPLIKDGFNNLLTEMRDIQSVNALVIKWRGDKKANREAIIRGRREMDDLLTSIKSRLNEKNGLTRLQDALLFKKYKLLNRREGQSLAVEYLDRHMDAPDLNVFQTEIFELTVILEQIYHCSTLDEFQDLLVNNLYSSMTRIDALSNSYMDGELKTQITSLINDLKMLIYGSQEISGNKVEPRNFCILKNAEDYIELVNQRKVLLNNISSHFGHLKHEQMHLIIAFNQQNLEFQKDVDIRLEKMWYVRLKDSIIGALVLLVFTLLIAERIRRQNFRLRRMAEELYDQRKKALDSVEAKSNFMANMSHEIRTPMNAILGFSDLLSKTKLNFDQKKYLDIVRSSGGLLVSIIDDILDISKLESGKIQLEMVEFNLEDIIKEVFKMVVLRMKDRPFDTYVQIADDIPAVVKGDPTRLKQIFVNLLGNAVKFTSSGSIGVIVDQDKDAAHTGDDITLRVTIKDTGIGIPANKIETIFKPFTQADESTTRKYGGTGLGLTICRALVEAMGGRIWVESQEGVGSEFIFVVKLKESRSVPAPSGQKEIKYPWLSGKTVFIVDDNKISIQLITKKCEILGLQVFGIADSGPSAISKLEKLFETRNVIPDVIFCDIIMEGMDGYELVHELKSRKEFQSVCYVAISADSKNKEKATETDEFYGHITKPIFLEDIVKVLEDNFIDNNLSREQKASEDSTFGTRILVVEDTETNLLLMQEYFIQFGWRGVFVSSGREAIDLLMTDCQFELCLMDLQMPDIGGIEAAKIIREKISKDLPIIALSAAVLEKDYQEAKDSGMNGFLNKPINISQLKETVARYTLGGKGNL